MLNVNNVTLQFGKRVLFEDVNIKFHGERCYGLIGANGAGKSTFLKILSDEMAPNSGNVSLESGKRMSVLSQDHFTFDEETVLNTVIQGNKPLWELMQKKEAIYMKEDFNEEDGLIAANLEVQFEEMDGWNSESDAANLLSGLGITTEDHYTLMKDMEGATKVRVLLAQALFGNPDILILDEPTNDLDLKTISWLEDFLIDFRNTVIVVSHDRHFLDTVCTNIADIDFKRIKQYTGNYTFWYESSQLALRQRQSANKKAEDKRKELQDFISRFAANASKSKQATSRKKMLEKINVDDIQASSRSYPAIIFDQNRDAGDQILEVDNLSANDDAGNVLFQNVTFKLNRGDKVSLISDDHRAITVLLEILSGNQQATSGSFSFGQTISSAYLPNENADFFQSDDNLMDWLREYSPDNKDEVFVRGFLGKMLFSGEEVFKSSTVLSGGEKVRCMLSRMMLQQANLLFMDEPTNHLDLESIQALNNGMRDFKGTMIFSSHDHTINQTVANRIIEVFPRGVMDKMVEFDEYIADKKITEQRTKMAAK
ncbi:MAG TPA: ABC-F family ATPase [Cryomorphaceae bacterium]|jgi:ATPase subunit of ABC transporter with duplicated ATPase domains|nr:ABC-F family ATPase [Cryomorphaceae bacterium]HCY25530.1 ABC-F family ATPase [Cryomorphaceae bacterium]|tara:strand:- start:4099 stop:5721 length:1623 start_codon:yes stop_codon:yes gene_type:complete